MTHSQRAPQPRARRRLALALTFALAWVPVWAAAALALERVADGVYVHWGAQEESAPSNQGAISNSAVVVGERCVAVIDTGGSLAFGLRLRQAVAALSDKPVCAVINTHLHPDHLLGNLAFAEPGINFYGHAQLPDQLALRAQAYLTAAQRDLGVEVAGPHVHVPVVKVQGAFWLDLGGRRLRLEAQAKAHTATDLTVWDERSNTLLAGDLLFVGHVPVVDGSVRGWLAWLEAFSRQRYERVVPGHGPLLRDAALARPQQDYLQRLVKDTRQALQQGQGLQEAVPAIAPRNLENWLLFDLFHRRNVAAVYTELEWE